MSGAAPEALTVVEALIPAAAHAASERGHTQRGLFAICGDTIELAFAPDADLDGAFRATCLETGDQVRANGWMFETIEVSGAGRA